MRRLFVNALELHNVTKRFGEKVIANDHVSLTVRRGEILAVLGENGSGKTTLMNMIAGIYHPDEGEIYVNGQPVTISSPRDAFRCGIGMVHQHFKLVDVFTATENIVLGVEDGKPYRLKEATRRVEEISARYGFEIDAKKKIYAMSVSEKQTVEIVKVLYRGAEILILDEPTAVLTPQETEKLFAVLRRMREDGKSIVIITHKLNEVLSLSDRVTVLHKGKSVATVNTAETDEYALTSLMVGHAVDLNIQRAEASVGSELLDVHALNVFRADGSQALKDVSFTLSAGEILGVAGVAGSGQKELCESIAGLHPIAGGSILMENKRIDGLTPREIINRGVSMSFIPEDRLGMGLAGGLSLYDNLLLKTYRDQKGVFLRRRQAKDEAVQMVKELEISTPSISTQVRKLSGGNVQKVLLGRELNANPRVLITAYPVRGLDINSSMTIYHLLNEQKKKGVGVLFIGEDLDVLLSLCDRILVLCNGRVSAIVNSKYATKELLGLKMTGAWEHDDEEDDYA